MATHIAVGIGLREPHIGPLLALADRSAVDVLEVMIDDALVDGPRRAAWRKLGARWPLIAHGTELGIGDAAGVDHAYVTRVQRALAELHVHWYSEHLAFLRGGDVNLGHFAPVFHDDQSLAALAENARVVANGLPCPFLLENSADILGFGGSDGRALGTFYGRALEAAACGGLLDLTNLIYGAKNDGYDTRTFLDALPWDRIVEVHLAGGRQLGDLWIDTHSHPVEEDALRWLPMVAERAPALRAVIIERDDCLPPLEELLNEVARVRRALSVGGTA